MEDVPVLGDFIDRVTHFCFVAEVVSCAGEFVDIENAVYTQWMIEGDSETRLPCAAVHKMNDKFAPKVGVGQRYLFTNGAFCRELGAGIIPYQMPVPLFYVMTSETRVASATSADCAGRARLSDLVACAMGCEFWGCIRGITEVDTEFDPDNPSFRVLISDGPESPTGTAIAAEGAEVAANVYPLCRDHRKLRFRGGQLKMDYRPKSLRIQWNNQTVAEVIE
jgi:hypothetical protein